MDSESGLAFASPSSSLADQTQCPRQSVWRQQRSSRHSPWLLCIACTVTAVLTSGCSGSTGHDSDNTDDEGDAEDALEDAQQVAAATREWTMLGNIGVAEASDKVGSNASRQWIIQCPDEWTERLANFGQNSSGEIKWRGDGANGVSAILYEGTQEQLHECLVHNSGALFVEEVIPVEASNLRGATERRLEEQSFADSRLWGLDRIDDADGLDRSYNNFGITGEGTSVFVLDTGIRTTHQEFEGRAVPEIDVTVFPAQRCRGDANCAADRNGHGTHCAATIAGRTVGVAKRATVHAVKVLGDDGSGSNAGIIQAINFVAAQDRRPAVISMSLGCSRPCQSRSEAIAIAAANRAGVTVVVAAGNNGRTSQPDACAYAPASIPQAITVASITINDDGRSDFSNIGSCIDIFAPGSDIFSASHRRDDAFTTLSGTSMACPHVSGVAALMLSVDPTMNPDEVERRIVEAAQTNKVRDSRGSPNRLLFMGGLAAAPSPAPTPVPPTPSTSTPISSEQYTLLGQGFCRTASGARGTFTVMRQTTLAGCQAACTAQVTCIGVEFQQGKCELHIESLARVAPSQSASCFVKLQSTTQPPEDPPIRFVSEISEGTCSDVGGLAINDIDLCQRAAAVLGVPDRTATRTRAVSRPEGCYVFRGRSLFMGTNPQSRGNGAETSTPGRSRHPICGFVA